MTVIFVCPCVPKISATHFVALNKIDISYMVCGRLLATLFRGRLLATLFLPPPAWSLPFRLTGNSRKGRAGWELAPKRFVSAYFWPDYFTTLGLSTRVESIFWFLVRNAATQLALRK